MTFFVDLKRYAEMMTLQSSLSPLISRLSFFEEILVLTFRREFKQFQVTFDRFFHLRVIPGSPGGNIHRKSCYSRLKPTRASSGGQTVNLLGAKLEKSSDLSLQKYQEA